MRFHERFGRKGQAIDPRRTLLPARPQHLGFHDFNRRVLEVIPQQMFFPERLALSESVLSS